MKLFVVCEASEGRTFIMRGENSDEVHDRFIDEFYDAEFYAEEEPSVTVVEVEPPEEGLAYREVYLS